MIAPSKTPFLWVLDAVYEKNKQTNKDKDKNIQKKDNYLSNINITTSDSNIKTL